MDVIHDNSPILDLILIPTRTWLHDLVLVSILAKFYRTIVSIPKKKFRKKT
jgi:hypothetical protein